MPRSPKDNQEIRDARREEILAAATKVFSEKGFADTKISEIAAAAGLSHGLVYHYFDSKDAIFAAIADGMMARIDFDLELSVPKPRQRLIAALESKCRQIREPIDAGRVVLQAALQGSIPEPVRARMFEHFRGLHAKLVEWIFQAQQAGEVDDALPAEEIASALVCVMRGMQIRPPSMPELPFRVPQTQTIARLLLPPPSAPVRNKNKDPRASAPNRTKAAKPRGSSNVKPPRRT
jgi:AcrR family transcriptional regulator